ncbi:hypothetical protein [Roseisolibacter sp. H3M3-2]|uniref:hypothetical protein n=1 Tax=Roseisolibacter sp. H3M3-2 TaxID=3031323 RepID=UPI0023DAFBCC|nr:hypothetical protein [Roseisolibacter sp. H3M3-2]MDF1506130.1 hypothetical protein [Roseisolibacter sp. H3M3-2]
MRRARPTRAPRRGDAIVEALVATLLLAVGALALLSLGAVLRRDARRGGARLRAAELLEARLAEWRATPCDGPASGTRVVGALRERWTVARDADSLEVLRDSVLAPGDAGQGGVALVAVRGCAP